MSSPCAAVPRGQVVRRREKPPLGRRAMWRLLMALYPVMWLTWWAVERLYSATHSRYLDLGAPYNMLRVRALAYDGPPVRLGDGRVVRPGDRILNLHINSPVARRMWREHVHPYAAGAEDLRSVALFLAAHPEYVAVHGRNKLRHMMRRLGAEVFDVPPSTHATLEQLFEEMAILIFHPHRLQRLERHYSPVADSWFSREVFLSRFAAGRAT